MPRAVKIFGSLGADAKIEKRLLLSKVKRSSCVCFCATRKLSIQLKLEICSVSTNGKQASPAQQEGSQLIGCHFSYLCTSSVDKHAHILVKSLPNCQELVNISVHKCIPM